MAKRMALKWAGRTPTENRYQVVMDGLDYEHEAIRTRGNAGHFNTALCADSVEIGEFVKLCKNDTARRCA